MIDIIDINQSSLGPSIIFRHAKGSWWLKHQARNRETKSSSSTLAQSTKPVRGSHASHSLSALGNRQWQITYEILPKKLAGLVQAVARGQQQLEGTKTKGGGVVLRPTCLRNTTLDNLPLTSCPMASLKLPTGGGLNPLGSCCLPAGLGQCRSCLGSPLASLWHC